MSMHRSGLSVLLITLFAFMFSFTQVAHAKKLGGGGSFGYSKQIAPKSYSTKQTTDKKASTAPSSAAAASGTAAKSGASKWLGPLAGLAAGGLLAAMLFGDGFEGIQFMDILLFALIAFILFKLFARRKQQQQPEMAYSQYQREEYQAPQQPAQPVQTQTRQTHDAYDPHAGGSLIGSGLSGEAPSENAQPVTEMPEWFNEQGFVEGAKDHYIALQKAWDDVDLVALESYCTPELYQALANELQGVQPGENQTTVDSIFAEVADKVVENGYFIVSVRFSGFIDEGEGAHSFTEIWHIRRLEEGEGNWHLAGIQQEVR